jgi:hypothetical protein
LRRPGGVGVDLHVRDFDALSGLGRVIGFVKRGLAAQPCRHRADVVAQTGSAGGAALQRVLIHRAVLVEHDGLSVVTFDPGDARGAGRLPLGRVAEQLGAGLAQGLRVSDADHRARGAQRLVFLAQAVDELTAGADIRGHRRHAAGVAFEHDQRQRLADGRQHH